MPIHGQGKFQIDQRSQCKKGEKTVNVLDETQVKWGTFSYDAKFRGSNKFNYTQRNFKALHRKIL